MLVRAVVNQSGMGPLRIHNLVKSWKDPVLTGRICFWTPWPWPNSDFTFLSIFVSGSFVFLLYWWRFVVPVLLICFPL